MRHFKGPMRGKKTNKKNKRAQVVKSRTKIVKTPNRGGRKRGTARLWKVEQRSPDRRGKNPLGGPNARIKQGVCSHLGGEGQEVGRVAQYARLGEKKRVCDASFKGWWVRNLPKKNLITKATGLRTKRKKLDRKGRKTSRKTVQKKRKEKCQQHHENSNPHKPLLAPKRRPGHGKKNGAVGVAPSKKERGGKSRPKRLRRKRSRPTKKTKKDTQTTKKKQKS